MKFSRYVSHKEKYRPSSAAMDFVGVNRRQNESGVLRGGWSFRDNPRWGSVQNEHNHILWKGSNQSTRAVGFTRKIPLCVKIVKRVLKNLLKWSKKSMTHLVALGKNTLCESEQIPFSVCGKSFYCQLQQDVACAFKTQTAIKTARSPAAKWPCRFVLYFAKSGSCPRLYNATLTGRTYTPSAV